MSIARAPSQPRRSAWMPWLFVAGLGIVVLVNAALIFFAVSSAKGLVVANPYEKGIAFNRQLARERAEVALGWKLAASYQNGAIEATLTDAGGRPLSNATVTALFVRPIEGGGPPPMALHAVAPGKFQGDIALPRLGQWDVTLEAVSGGNSFIETIRVVVR